MKTKVPDRVSNYPVFGKSLHIRYRLDMLPNKPFANLNHKAKNNFWL